MVCVPGDVLLHVAITECAWAEVSPGLSLLISQSDLTHCKHALVTWSLSHCVIRGVPGEAEPPAQGGGSS